MRTFLTLFVITFALNAFGERSCVDLFDSRKTENADHPRVLLIQREFVGEQDGVFVEASSGMFGRSQRVKRVYVKTRYLDPSEVAKTLAVIDQDARLRSNYPDALDFIFVVTLEGELRVFPKVTGESSLGRLKHSSLVNGEGVLMAGEIQLDGEGRIYRISNQSGHYLPPAANLKWFVQNYVTEAAAPLVRVQDITRKNR